MPENNAPFGENPVPVQPKIKTPFYKQWWFWLIVVIIAVVIANLSALSIAPNAGSKAAQTVESDFLANDITSTSAPQQQVSASWAIKNALEQQLIISDNIVAQNKAIGNLLVVVVVILAVLAGSVALIAIKMIVVKE